MNRALRAATLGVLLLSPVALSACSAGQVTQTATQERDKTGTMAQVGDIMLRQIELAYPSSGRYEPGDDAELHAAIINTGSADDALVDITGDAFQSVRVTGTGAAASGSASPSTGSSAPSTSGLSRPIDIPAHSTVFLGENGPHVTLADLTKPLTPAQSVTLTLTFEKAGAVTVQAIVATPDRDLQRGPSYNFHQEAEGEGH